MGSFSATDFAMLMMTNALTSSIVAILHGAVSLAGTLLVRVSDGQGRFLLQGEPGCGKSTAARLFAQKLGDCCLYPTFNPTSPGESLAELLRYVKRSQKVIVVMEEFDVVLRRVLREGKQAHKNFRVEVADKATWNNMMDMLQFQTRMGIILTTNRTDDEIAALNEEMGGSILRPGRITEWIRFPSSLHCKKEL
ncbi:putative 26S protease subunit rpt4 [Tetrabaena socialis]|uniref:Putative 26S protease subunit rpt4 n=1 Tax=Tetrabaena socialis TaxID=47790 RepID=A0A2J7ZVY6_9CHLO|nr:putative 26S protease subunit rpt4 [Tetrabaena socialis]|eukprot:PNH04430.1 putative 26S protease subunit rpt4 [Tetrabaena socialis]